MTGEIQNKETALVEITKLKEQIEENNAKLRKSDIDEGAVSCCQSLQDAVGQEKSSLASHIVGKTAYAIDSQANEITPKSLQIALESVDAQKPKDAVEVKLIAQAAALYSNGMDFLERDN